MTREDVRIKAKNSRVFKKHNGLNSGPKGKIAGSKGTPFKKKVGGELEWR